MCDIITLGRQHSKFRNQIGIEYIIFTSPLNIRNKAVYGLFTGATISARMLQWWVQSKA